MADPDSRLEADALDAPRALARQLSTHESLYDALGGRLRALDPLCAGTLAQGSSAFAAAYGAFLVTLRLGIPVAALPPAIATLHRTPLRLPNALVMAISQSGETPDVLDALAAARRAGALTVSLVNREASSLAEKTEWLLPVSAGQEGAALPTKSILASLSALVRLVGHWTQDRDLLEALLRLPDCLAEIASLPSEPFVEALADSDRILVLGGGLCGPLAREAALKFGELCGIRGEALSEAELQGGFPSALEPEDSLLVLAPRGPLQRIFLEVASEHRKRGANVLVLGPIGAGGPDLPLPEAPHELLDGLCILQAFYPAVARLARARGLDPDAHGRPRRSLQPD